MFCEQECGCASRNGGHQTAGGHPVVGGLCSRQKSAGTLSSHSQAGSLWHNPEPGCCWSLSVQSHIPRISLLGGNAPDLCLQSCWWLGGCHPTLLRGIRGHQQGSLWHRRLGQNVNVEHKSCRDRGGQSREAGAVKHCGHRGSVLRGEPRGSWLSTGKRGGGAAGLGARGNRAGFRGCGAASGAGALLSPSLPWVLPEPLVAWFHLGRGRCAAWAGAGC